MHGPAILAADTPWSDPHNQTKIERLLAGARRSGNRYLPILAACASCGSLTVSRLRSDRWRVRQWPAEVSWAEVAAEADRELTAKYGPSPTS